MVSYPHRLFNEVSRSKYEFNFIEAADLETVTRNGV